MPTDTVNGVRPGTVLITVKPQRIADMMVGAIEGGSNYWCDGVYLESAGDVAPDDPNRGDPWYANPIRYADPDLRLKIVEIDEDSGATTDHIVTQADIENGLKLMAEKSGQHFGDLMQETDDAITADVFLQYVTFGEVVYG